MSKSAIVIGAGVVGLATARALAIRGYKVTVFERTEKAVGASIRNFGMIWPIGQPSGMMYERAMVSKYIWKEISSDMGLWKDEVGSLHLAYNNPEAQVLEEFYEAEKGERSIHLLTAGEVRQRSEATIQEGLEIALFSEDEMIVDPREAMVQLPIYLNQKYNVQFIWSSAVTKVFYPAVWCGKKCFEADEIFICNGADFKTLFLEQFAALPITKCKLQMMRTEAQAPGWRLGPGLCGGLSLLHYKSFEVAPSLKYVKQKLEEELSDYLKWGIHVMVCQNEKGQLTIGDSHEYGQSFEPFDRTFINEMILRYLKKFAQINDERIYETWNGIYSKLTDGRTEIMLKPQSGVTIINGLGGAGMTLSFGLCEQIIAGIYQNSIAVIK